MLNYQRPNVKIFKEKVKRFPCGQRHRVFLIACDCGDKRWVVKSQAGSRCMACASSARGLSLRGKPKGTSGNGHPLYRKGFTYSHGYRVLSVPFGHPYRPMAGRLGKLPEHRLVMAKHLGRLLKSWEQVHHINGVKDDNRIENLELFSASQHMAVTALQLEIRRLEKEVDKLRKENERLSCRLKS